MQDVYYTLPEAREPGEGETVYTVALEQLDQYFTPQVNVPYERHLFRTMAQLPSESVDQFITRLREREEYCEFGNAKDENIRDQVIEKCISSRLRSRRCWTRLAERAGRNFRTGSFSSDRRRANISARGR